MFRMYVHVVQEMTFEFRMKQGGKIIELMGPFGSGINLQQYFGGLFKDRLTQHFSYLKLKYKWAKTAGQIYSNSLPDICQKIILNR